VLFSIHSDDDVKQSAGLSGYAYGYHKIKENFSKFTYGKETLSVVDNSPSASVQMFYMEPNRLAVPSMKNLRQPDFTKFHDHQYKIYGTHLEATKMWSHWIDEISKADEVWVGNYFARDAVLNSGIKVPTYVFEHGIDEMWQPKRRGKNSKIKFLHVDSGSPRKRADMAHDAFKDVFGDRDDVQLTLKYRPGEEDGGYDVMSLFTNSNVVRMYSHLSQEEMVQLYYDHDVLIYPSEGEGFGFIPLQALASGMPVISTSRWCSYEKFLGKNIIESKIGPTSHTGYFEGEVVLADYDSLVHLIKKVYDNIDSECDFYFSQSEKVYKEYNWEKRSKEMLNSFIKRKGISILDPHPDYIHQIPVEIMYIGNGSYSTASGTRFSKENRIGTVTKFEYDSLISSGNFQKVV
jgi:glycosyltransferase involved in cell wall biosynthesis